ncbi:MAG: aminotransferase class V-fold PLP-dependent enzyme, partial [Gammaproteobacteria bacterium]
LSRRGFLRNTGLAGAAALTGLPTPTVRADSEAAKVRRPVGEPEAVARDEAFWREVASLYDVDAEITNLENGYWGVMPRHLLTEYEAHTERVNRANASYARKQFYVDYRGYRERAAEEIGVQTGEIMFTRGATEALQNLIANYNLLEPGDAVMYADLDYGGMQETMDWLTERRGVSVVRFDISEPASYDAVLSTYERMLTENPKVRLLLLTHVSNRTGLVMPVREIAAMARARNVDVILDAAHSFGHLDFKLADLGVDFMGINFHKWMGAPLGSGLMYIRKERLKDIDPCFGNRSFPSDNILTRASSGTSNFAAFMVIPSALDFHQQLGPANKEARLRYLRNRWVDGVRDLKQLEILTPDDPRMTGALTSFRIKGRNSRDENRAIVANLLDNHRIFTVWRDGVAAGDCVRVTPGVYTRAEDVDRLATALRTIARS